MRNPGDLNREFFARIPYTQANLDNQGVTSLVEADFLLTKPRSSPNSAQVFNGIDDFLNVAFGITFLFITIASCFVKGAVPVNLRNFVGEILFLDTPHVVLTFVLIAGLPQLRAWTKSASGGRPKLFLLPVLMAGVLVFIVSFTTTFFSGHQNQFLSIISVAFLIVDMTFPRFHGLWQIKGISLAYNQKMYTASALDQCQTEKIRRHEALEKRGFILFYWTVICANLAFLFPFESVGLAIPEFWLSRMQATSFILCFTTGFFICANSFFYPLGIRSSKFLFLLRLMIYPFMGFSPTAFLGVRSCHGVEYLFVYRAILQNADVPRSQRRHLDRWSIFLCLLISFMILPWWLTSQYNQDWYFVLSVSLIFGLIYAHFLMDRIFFRMRNPQTRKIVGQLLLGQRGA